MEVRFSTNFTISSQNKNLQDLGSVMANLASSCNGPWFLASLLIMNFDFSVDCVKWGLLPQVTEEMRQNCSFVKGRFTGDPSYEYEHTESKRSEERDPVTDPDEETTVRK